MIFWQVRENTRETMIIKMMIVIMTSVLMFCIRTIMGYISRLFKKDYKGTKNNNFKKNGQKTKKIKRNGGPKIVEINDGDGEEATEDRIKK